MNENINILKGTNEKYGNKSKTIIQSHSGPCPLAHGRADSLGGSVRANGDIGYGTGRAKSVARGITLAET